MKKNLLLVLVVIFIATSLWAGYVVEDRSGKQPESRDVIKVNSVIAKTIELYKKQTDKIKDRMQKRLKTELANYVKASYTNDDALMKSAIDNFKKMFDELSKLNTQKSASNQASRILQDMRNLLEILPDSLTLTYKMQILSQVEAEKLVEAEEKLTALSNFSREYAEEVILNNPGFLKNKLDEYKVLTGFLKTRNDLNSCNILKKIQLADMAFQSDDFESLKNLVEILNNDIKEKLVNNFAWKIEQGIESIIREY